MNGVIRFCNWYKGYGYIITEDGDYNFIVKELENGRKTQQEFFTINSFGGDAKKFDLKGKEVSFTPYTDEQGKKAKDIKTKGDRENE